MYSKIKRKSWEEVIQHKFPLLSQEGCPSGARAGWYVYKLS